MAVGRPREYDRAAIALKLEAYLDATPIPILAEFAARERVTRELLYEWDEPFPTLLKRFTNQKEGALERLCYDGCAKSATAMAIFSLKQLGWKDRVEHSGDKNAPVAFTVQESKL